MARIQNNMMAMNTHRQYTINNEAAAASAEKLSSGYRINRAGDDAAGLAISEKMRAQIRGLNMAAKNSQDAISLVQTAEGALQEVHSMLQRMNELADQSATGTNEGFDRSAISAEFEQLKEEINDIAEQTTFNNMKLFDGSLAKNVSDAIGDINAPGGSGNAGRADKIQTMTVAALTAAGVTKYKGTDIAVTAAGTTPTKANAYLSSNVTFTASDTNPFETGVLLETSAVVRNNPNAILTAGSADSLSDVIINVGDKQLTFVGSSDSRIQAGTKLDYKALDGKSYTLTFADADGNRMDIKVNTGDANGIGTDIVEYVGNMGQKGLIAFSDTDVNKVNTGSSAIGAVASAVSTDAGKTPFNHELTVQLAFGNDNALAVGKYTIDAVVVQGNAESTLATDSIAGNVVLRLRDEAGNVTEFKFDADASDITAGEDLQDLAKDEEIGFSDGRGNVLKFTIGTATNGMSAINAAIGKQIQVDPASTGDKTNLEAGLGVTYGEITNVNFNDAALQAGKNYNIKLGVINDAGTVFTALDDEDPAFATTATIGGLAAQITDDKGNVIQTLKIANVTDLRAVDGTSVVAGSTLTNFNATDKGLAKNQTLKFESATKDFSFELKLTEDVNGTRLNVALGKVHNSIYSTGEAPEDPGNPTKPVVPGEDNGGITIQVGANQGEVLNFNIESMSAEGLGIMELSIATQASASDALGKGVDDGAGEATGIKKAINLVSEQRAQLGAIQNRLTHKINNLNVSAENLQAAEARIRDVDMAKEMTNFTKQNILSQAATAMLAQANSAPQNVLQLLR